jgi:thiamine-monophosphate kinase
MATRRSSTTTQRRGRNSSRANVSTRSRGADANVSEFGAIDVIRRILSTRAQPSSVVKVGIGDDCAVLGCSKGELVWSVDASVEGVHFDTRWLSMEAIARRAFHAAASDLAAMGAKPLGALVALQVPKDTTAQTFRAIAKGQARAVRETQCPIVGGNITRGDQLTFTTTVLGECKPGAALLRSGATPGDEVWLSDEVGWAGLGLGLLQSGEVTFTSGRHESNVDSRAALRAVDRWCAPHSKLDTGLVWAKGAHSLIDTSDSLASEALHLANASGVAIELDASQLMAAHPRLVRAAHKLGREPLPLILHGGEDYALLGTGPSRKRPPAAKVIGWVNAGKGATLLVEGERVPLTSGFDHLAQK